MRCRTVLLAERRKTVGFFRGKDAWNDDANVRNFVPASNAAHKTYEIASERTMGDDRNRESLKLVRGTNEDTWR